MILGLGGDRGQTGFLKQGLRLFLSERYNSRHHACPPLRKRGRAFVRNSGRIEEDTMAEGEKAFNGKILNVYLSQGKTEAEQVPEHMYREYLGGYGLGARLLFDRIPAGADPLGPENVLGLIPGLLTGTPLFGIRYQAVAKSPKNNGWGDANCGGDFGPHLKLAGWDGILLYGKADKLSYVLVDNDNVEIRDATDLAGMLAIDVEETL